MDWVSHTVSAFGHSVGIADLSLDDDGCALFSLEPSGVLCVHDLQPAGGDDVLVILGRPLGYPHATSVRRAMLMTDFRKNTTWQMQLSMRGDELFVTLRMPRHAFMLSALEDAVESLFNFHASVAEAN